MKYIKPPNLNSKKYLLIGGIVNFVSLFVLSIWSIIYSFKGITVQIAWILVGFNFIWSISGVNLLQNTIDECRNNGIYSMVLAYTIVRVILTWGVAGMSTVGVFVYAMCLWFMAYCCKDNKGSGCNCT